MSAAIASKATENSPETEQNFCQGKIGTQAFKANEIKHDLRSGYWFIEGTERDLETNDRRVVLFRYLADPKQLPSGRYTLRPGEPDERFTVIYMELNNTPPPAGTAGRGTIEFIHNEQTNEVTGALDVYYFDSVGNEVRMEILFRAGHQY